MLLESRNEVAILRCSHVFRVLYTQLTFKSVGEPDYAWNDLRDASTGMRQL